MGSLDRPSAHNKRGSVEKLAMVDRPYLHVVCLFLCQVCSASTYDEHVLSAEYVLHLPLEAGKIFHAFGLSPSSFGNEYEEYRSIKSRETDTCLVVRIRTLPC